MQRIPVSIQLGRVKRKRSFEHAQNAHTDHPTHAQSTVVARQWLSEEGAVPVLSYYENFLDPSRFALKVCRLQVESIKH